jgi:hypothetical protein
MAHFFFCDLFFARWATDYLKGEYLMINGLGEFGNVDYVQDQEGYRVFFTSGERIAMSRADKLNPGLMDELTLEFSKFMDKNM